MKINNNLFWYCLLFSMMICVAQQPTFDGVAHQAPVMQLPAPERQHDGISCGPRALITAWAIDQLVNNKQAVTPQNIRSLFHQKKHLIPSHDLEALEIEEWNNRDFNIKHLYIFQQDASSTTYKFHPAAWAGFDSIDKIYLAIKRVILSAQWRDTASLHIIYNTGGHWTLVSYIKEYEKNPRLLYIDSVDQPLKTQRSSQQFVNAFWQTIITPLALVLPEPTN